MKNRIVLLLIVVLSLGGSYPALSHPGRTNSEGCHGGSKPWHCHPPKNQKPKQQPSLEELEPEQEPRNEKDYSPQPQPQPKKETNPKPEPKRQPKPSASVAPYNRKNWGFKSSTARRLLKCSRTEHVDHVVALKEAYDSGAAAWTNERKRLFANDRDNFMCLDGRLNMSKSDKDLAEWPRGDCALRVEIAKISIRVKAKYGLSIDEAELSALVNPCGTNAAK